MNTQRTVPSTQRVPNDITPATFAFNLLFNAAQSIHRAHETTPSTYALPLWKTHVSYLLTAITHGANELAHTELPSLLTLQQDVNNLALHLTSLLAPTFNNPLPTPPTPSTPKPRTTPSMPHLKHVSNHSIRPTPKKPEPRLHWVPNRPETPPRTPSPQPTPPRTPSPTPTHHSVDSVDTVEFLLEPPLYDHPIGPLEKPLYDHPAGPVEGPIYSQPAGPMEGPIYDQPAGPMEGPIYPCPAGPDPFNPVPYQPQPRPFVPTRTITLKITSVLRRPTATGNIFTPSELSDAWQQSLLSFQFMDYFSHYNILNVTYDMFTGFNWTDPSSTAIRSSILMSYPDDDAYLITRRLTSHFHIYSYLARKRDVFNNSVTYSIYSDQSILAASSSSSAT